MEQFRQIGEVLGSLRALTVFRGEIRVNQRQCCLLVDALNLAFEAIADEIRSHLRFEERVAKWKPLEQPLKELHRVFREGEQYIRQCLETKDWWAKALSMGLNTDCVELHLHNLLWCVPVVLEAIENVGEASGSDQDETINRRLVFSKKYEREWIEPKLFQHKYGRLYLVSQDLRGRFDTAWKEDRWILSETVAEKRGPESKALTKHENRLAELLTAPKGKLFPCSVLAGSQDYYQVRKRLGSGSSYKEIQWMGESFAAKHVIGDVEPVKHEIALLSSVSHPNVMHCLYAFCDEEKKECYMVMELMSKDLSGYIKETCCSRKRVPFSLAVAVDVMLQIARGMEYLHSRKIYHGDLNPSNILVKPRTSTPEGYLHVKVAGFGLMPVKNSKAASTNQSAAAAATTTTNPCIWYAPEVLSEQEQQLGTESTNSKHTEKADVYSFAMICFELLTGKIPFEDGHLQGDKMSRNIRAGERPLFPFPSPKYLTGLTKRCWQTDPSQRPTFSSLCRVLRYIKRFLIMNPDQSLPDPPVPPLDYFDLETSLSKCIAGWGRNETLKVSEIPFQMYAYRALEREKTSANLKEKSSESGSEGASVCEDETPIISEDPSSASLSPTRSSSQASSDGSKKGSTTTKKADGKTNKQIGQNQKARTGVQASCARSLRVKSENRLPQIVMSPRRRRASGHASDSELA